MPRGGARPGAGRPKTKSPSTTMRVPVNYINAITDLIDTGGFKLPVYGGSVSAGTPSFTTDHIETYANLHSTFVTDPANTFLMRATGDSMINVGINDKDMLIVNNNLEAKSGNIVIAFVDNEATVKRLRIDKAGVFLIPENEHYAPIRIDKHSDLKIAGVVTGVMRQLI